MRAFMPSRQGSSYDQNLSSILIVFAYQLRQLMVVSHSLSPAAASTLVLAFVVSHLDFCSAIYEGLQTCRLKCLDKILRMAAHLLGSAGSLGICGMSVTGSPTHSALCTAPLRWFGTV